MSDRLVFSRNDLSDRFFHVMMLWRRNHLNAFKAYGPFGNPHQGQGRVLALLRTQPELSQKKMGCLLDMRGQSLGELLAKLERDGWIVRLPSQADRRAMIVRLTEAGREATGKLSDIAPHKTSPFDCLTEAEQDLLRGFLDRIIASMRRPGEELPSLREPRPFGRHACEAHSPFDCRWPGDALEPQPYGETPDVSRETLPDREEPPWRNRQRERMD